MPPARPKSIVLTAAFETGANDAVQPGAVLSGFQACGTGGSRVRVLIDGAPVGEIPTVVVSDLRLVVGMPWDQALAERVIEAAWDAVTFAGLLRLISARARSCHAYQQRLIQRGFPKASASKAIERALAAELINETTVLQLAIEADLRRGYARRVVIQRLGAQGFAREAVQDVLDARTDDASEAETAAQLAHTWARARSARLDPAVARRRLMGYLARRGFSGEACRNAATAALIPERNAYPDA